MSFKPLALTNTIKVKNLPIQKIMHSYNKRLMLNVDKHLNPVILGFEILGKTETFTVEDTDESSDAISLKKTTRSFTPEDEDEETYN